MSAHTPGEWTAKGGIVRGPDGELICFTTLAGPVGNARLIAAVPKLLALCESFAGLMPAKQISFVAAELILDELNELCEQANRVLEEITTS